MHINIGRVQQQGDSNQEIKKDNMALLTITDFL